MDIKGRYKEIIQGMESDDIQVQWDTMIRWFDLWITVEKRDLEPLLSLVHELKAIGFWDTYYPSQSHCSLGLSLGKNYNLRYDLPMVYIGYHPTESNFSIQYQKGQGGDTTVAVCENGLSREDFENIEKWLNDNRNRRVKDSI